ncbi:MAG: SoxR reducing system RseC family protein [Gammaproteobacteria bacterium]|nr:SoxR reducing system RseC family protein [Gammaproteobacteria bacterium]
MIEETAIVVAVEGGDVLLQTQRRSACQSCRVKQGCGTSVLAKVVGQRSSQIRIQNTLNAKLGDEVVLGLNENALVQGSLMVYALPLVMMLVFAVIAEYWASTQDMNTELLAILGAVLGFVSALMITRFYITNRRVKSAINPHMLRRVHTVLPHRDTMLAP